MAAWFKSSRAWRYVIDLGDLAWSPVDISPVRIIALPDWQGSASILAEEAVIPRPEATWVLLAVHEGRIVGHHALQRQGSSRALLFGGNTISEYRRRGVMRGLTFELFRIASGTGIKRIEASVGVDNLASQALCATCGMYKLRLERRFTVFGHDLTSFFPRWKSS